ncbi:MAG TPA: glycosyltransferase family 2 protein [Phycisphaerales bacterium]|nr:glycosyltransferase family 2 protein [Phycisphaerales bacterium]
MSELHISVIFPTRNRASTLSKALESLLAQTMPLDRFEVIVADNGSTDDTAEICRNFSKQFPHFQYLFVAKPGLHQGRHAGMDAAGAPILTFADDDIVAFPSWLSGISEAFQDPSVGLVGGKNLPQWESNPPHWVWEKWFTSRVKWGQRLGELSLIDFGSEIQEIDPYYVYGCNFSIRKSILTDSKGFHPDGMPQDLIAYRGDGESYVSGFVKRAGYKTLYHPDASVYHLVPTSRMTEDYFCRRAFNQGVSDSFASVRARGCPDTQEPVANWKRLLTKLWNNNILRRDIIRLQEDLEASELDRSVKRSYRRGYLFHQEMCRESSDILQWTLRPHYLGD